MKEKGLWDDFTDKVAQSVKARDKTIPLICYVCETEIRDLPIYRTIVFEDSNGDSFQLRSHYFPPCGLSFKHPENCSLVGSGLSMPLEWVTKNSESYKRNDLNKIEEEIQKDMVTLYGYHDNEQDKTKD